MSKNTTDLEEEANYIQRGLKSLFELRKQHRKSVLDALRDPEADTETLAEILRKTESEETD